MFTLYPGRSLVQNIGFDGSGVHCAKSDYLNVDLSKAPIFLGDIPVEENFLAREKVKDFLWNNYSSPFAILRRAYCKIQNLFCK
jgi:hypothetical protein